MKITKKLFPEFQNFLLQYSGSAFNDDAQYYLGMTYYNKKQYLLGAYEFSKLIRKHSCFSVCAGFSIYAGRMLFPTISSISVRSGLHKKKQWRNFKPSWISFLPIKKIGEAEGKIKELNEKLAEKEYMGGLTYEKMSYERAALKYYATVSDTYHDTKFAPNFSIPENND